MTETPDPTWYDVLDVPRDASDEQIREAWRNATDRFGPGTSSGQFRMYNQAAEVLLDPARRAAYDRGLGEPEPSPEPEATPPPPEVPAAGVTLEKHDPADDRSARQRRRELRREAKAQRDDVRPVERPSRLQVLVAVGLAVLLVVAVGVAAFYGREVRRNSEVAEARAAAPATAERAAKAVLSYDYRRLDADQERAKDYLTPSYAKEFEKTFALLKENQDGSPGAAVQTKAVVTASVAGSGVVDAEADTVRVLVFVNQTSRKAGTDPRVFQNRVAMTMKKRDGKWLVNDVKSY